MSKQTRNTTAAEDTAAKPAREALLDAATVLFGECGPAAVSTRQIAAAAKVNSGLIHRHFRTKDALLGEVLERLSREISTAANGKDAGVSDLLRYLDATYERSLYWKLLARCILDGKDLHQLQSEFPTAERMRRFIADIQRNGAISNELDPRILTSLLLAAGLGWLVFEPFLLAANDLEGEDMADVRRRVRRTMLSLLTREE